MQCRVKDANEVAYVHHPIGLPVRANHMPSPERARHWPELELHSLDYCQPINELRPVSGVPMGGRALRVRKATRAESERLAIYCALNLGSKPGVMRKTIV